MLQCAGVQLVPFSPLHDRQLPPGVSAVLLGGVQQWSGAEQLQSNVAVVEALPCICSCRRAGPGRGRWHDVPVAVHPAPGWTEAEQYG